MPLLTKFYFVVVVVVLFIYFFLDMQGVHCEALDPDTTMLGFSTLHFTC